MNEMFGKQMMMMMMMEMVKKKLNSNHKLSCPVQFFPILHEQTCIDPLVVH